MNWSGFVKRSIEEKAKSLAKAEGLKARLKEERPVTDWAVKLQRASQSGRLAELTAKRLI